MSSRLGVTIVVPTYNEAENIVTLCERVAVRLPDASVLVVDDDSPDGTADIIERWAAAQPRTDQSLTVRVLRRPAKSGLGSAYRDGFAAAIADGASICVQMDADLSHDPADLAALVAIVNHGVDLVIGSRYVPGGRTENWPWSRRALSRWGNRYAAGVLGLAINDATAGYRAYSVDALQRMNFHTVRADGYGFQVEMTHRLVRANGRIVEYPVTFRDRTLGQSKLSGGIVHEAFGLVIRLWLADFGGRRRRRKEGR